MNKIKQRREELEKEIEKAEKEIELNAKGNNYSAWLHSDMMKIIDRNKRFLDGLNFADKERLKWFRELIEGIECNAYDNALWLKQMITNKLNEEEKNEN